jgi:hypothetical protein
MKLFLDVDAGIAMMLYIGQVSLLFHFTYIPHLWQIYIHQILVLFNIISYPSIVSSIIQSVRSTYSIKHLLSLIYHYGISVLEPPTCAGTACWCRMYFASFRL